MGLTGGGSPKGNIFDGLPLRRRSGETRKEKFAIKDGRKGMGKRVKALND